LMTVATKQNRNLDMSELSTYVAGAKRDQLVSSVPIDSKID